MKLTVLGATGSIGVSTLDVVARHPDRFDVVALTGNTRIDLLEAQCVQHRPVFAVTGSSKHAVELSRRLKAKGLRTEVLFGPESLRQVAELPQADAVMAAIVGAAGLPPTLAAAKAGKRVLLANKEALVMAGQLFMDEMAGGGGVLLPIDSEHNAVFQAMPPFQAGTRPPGVAKIILTASGGPFRAMNRDELANVSVEQAIAHPNWSMGQKISVDSATMMNKGLEVIEAHWMFGMDADDIDVVIHPQSVIHSMVEYVDGSVVAQLGNPDMRTPIAHALAWPERISSGVSSLNLFQVGRLDFEPPDYDRFPCLSLAYQALRAGQDRGAVLNAANEIAVQAFLDRKITYLQIAEIVRDVLDQMPSQRLPSIDAVLDIDAASRRLASIEVARVGR